MLSKEQGITVVGVCIVYEFVVVQKLYPSDVITLRFMTSPKLLRWIRFCSHRLAVIVTSAVVLLVIR